MSTIAHPAHVVMPSQMVILAGLTMADFAAARPVQTLPQVFAEIPSRFIANEHGVTAWSALRTQLRCHTCSLHILSWPRFIPTQPSTEVINGQHTDTWKPLGLFCSYPCLARYIYHETPAAARYDYIQSTTIVEMLFSRGNKRMILPEGLPKTSLQAYAGPTGLTPAEFREKNEAIWNGQNITMYKTENISKTTVR